MRKLTSAAVCALLAGCAGTQVVEPVTVVPTHTPGMAFVLVRPLIPNSDKHRVQPRDNKQVDPNSEYILLCDARPVDGIRCSVPTEAALARYSYAPLTGNASKPIDEGIAALQNTDVEKQK